MQDVKVDEYMDNWRDSRTSGGGYRGNAGRASDYHENVDDNQREYGKRRDVSDIHHLAVSIHHLGGGRYLNVNTSSALSPEVDL
jgi:hypothetical protein